MKITKLLGAGALAALALTSTAQAAQGCGPGFHRGPRGVCRPNLGPGPAVVVGPRVGVFYTGRGWWDGDRYWQNRERCHGGWRYR